MANTQCNESNKKSTTIAYVEKRIDDRADHCFNEFPLEAAVPVKEQDGVMLGDPAQFRTTRWSAILLAAQSSIPGSEQALSDLCRDYWYPLYAFARRRGYPPHDAQDLTQGFFLSLLQRRALKRADPARGKFRSFLLSSFQNFLADEADRARSIKRGGKCKFIFLDAVDAETRYQLEPADDLTPEKFYDARWTVAVFANAVNRLQEACAARGETLRFQVLRPYVGIESGQAPPSYQEVANALGLSPGAAKTSVHRFRRQFAALLRQEIARTVSEPAEIDEEIRSLCAALVATEGQI